MPPILHHLPTSVAYGLRPPPLLPHHLTWPRPEYRVSLRPASFIALAVLPFRSSMVAVITLTSPPCSDAALPAGLCLRQQVGGIAFMVAD